MFLDGRTPQDWDQMAAESVRFLRDRAALERTTNYSELNATLQRRAGQGPFDLDLDSERAAMGHLLGLWSTRNSR
jgi:hypothetical protein